ncbi:MAG: hypothetical protein LBN97_08690 [Oscillospiraceae bacterium]|jgi:hypothetical protein|nr:hypothetical protein [Oscillospiraceae bacterium]
MTQITTPVTVQLDSELVRRLVEAAGKANFPASEFLTELVSSYCNAELRADLEKKLKLLELMGIAKDDETFTEPEDIPWESVVPQGGF